MFVLICLIEFYYSQEAVHFQKIWSCAASPVIKIQKWDTPPRRDSNPDAQDLAKYWTIQSWTEQYPKNFSSALFLVLSHRTFLAACILNRWQECCDWATASLATFCAVATVVRRTTSNDDDDDDDVDDDECPSIFGWNFLLCGLFWPSRANPRVVVSKCRSCSTMLDLELIESVWRSTFWWCLFDS